MAQQTKKPSQNSKISNDAKNTKDMNAMKNAEVSKGTKRKHQVEECVQHQTASTSKKPKGDEQITLSLNLHVPIDEGCLMAGPTKVYVDPNGLIHDATLNQTNFTQTNNNNKFYHLQLLTHESGYYTHTRWGRVGNKGDTKTNGPLQLGQALLDFEKKFKEKTGLTWNNRNCDVQKGKYTFLQMKYESMEDLPDGVGKKPKPELPPAKCSLPQQTQRLMELIFNEESVAKALVDIGYNSEKLSLDNLGKATLQKGFEYLRELGDLIADKRLAKTRHGVTYKEAVEDFTNRYYSTIPHQFGMKKGPLIDNFASLKLEAEMLDTLSDMEVTYEIMKSTSKLQGSLVHVLDQRFQELNLKEMSPVDHKSTEFIEIEYYLFESSSILHRVDYDLKEVFRIERSGEKARFQNSKFSKIENSNRRLLWHGSRTTNFGGILSQGLRIAPPEAPANGYAFGKGVYLADASSKSALYSALGGTNADYCLLLCEVELGNPMYELSCGSTRTEQLCKEKGCIATKGTGEYEPKSWRDASCIHPDLKGVLMPTGGVVRATNNLSGYLQHNEYIVYDTAQVRLRYLLQFSLV